MTIAQQPTNNSNTIDTFHIHILFIIFIIAKNLSMMSFCLPQNEGKLKMIKCTFEKYLDRAIYMMICTVYIMFGLAFTSTIIEIVR